jgi:rhodanese-related sulfurtransferase
MDLKHLQRTNLFLNAAIIIVIALIGLTVVKRYFGNDSAGAAVPTNQYEEIAADKPLSLRDVNWENNGKTVVLLLSQACRYCLESGPFYQRLTAALSSHPVAKVVAVFPNKVIRSQEFLDKLNVRTDEIKEASLIELGVKGTPTIALVNAKGIVTDSWRGKLTPKEESEVFDKLQLPNNISVPEEEKDTSVVGIEELNRLIKNDKSTIVLDVRDRAAYNKGHLDGAKNIPLDEVASRALNELSPKAPIVIYSGPQNEERCKKARQLLYERGFRSVLVLR